MSPVRVYYVVVPGANYGLDQVLLAGREGVSVLWYDVKTKKWTYQNIGTGLPPQPGNPFWGSGSGEYLHFKPMR